MARHEFPCTDAKVIVDTDANTVTIERSKIINKNIPQTTVIPLDQITAVETKSASFNIGNMPKGNVNVRLHYPGGATAGNLLVDVFNYDNTFQYKFKMAKEVDAVLDIIRAAAEENKKRMGL